jgi:hypothetical protein
MIQCIDHGHTSDGLPWVWLSINNRPRSKVTKIYRVGLDHTGEVCSVQIRGWRGRLYPLPKGKTYRMIYAVMHYAMRMRGHE